MDIKQLRYFVTIVNTKSFTAAARFLYVSQSALSKSMKERTARQSVRHGLYNALDIGSIWLEKAITAAKAPAPKN